MGGALIPLADERDYLIRRFKKCRDQADVARNALRWVRLSMNGTHSDELLDEMGSRFEAQEAVEEALAKVDALDREVTRLHEALKARREP